MSPEQHKNMLLQNSKEWLADELLAEQNRKHEFVMENIDLKNKIAEVANQLLVIAKE